MNLIDLKIPKPTKKELNAMKQPVVEGPSERYPYGMRLSFGTDLMPKFPDLEMVKVGEKVKVVGIGEVMEVRKVDRQGDKNQFSVEVQIQKIGVNGASSKSGPPKGTLVDAMKKSHRSA